MVRLHRITTKKGDGGQTGLADGTRLDKNHQRVEAMGAVDEANSFLGLVIDAIKADDKLKKWHGLAETLAGLQHDLFDIGADLATPKLAGGKSFMVAGDRVAKLETMLADYNKDLPPLTSFILPSGHMVVSHCHIARTMVRRAERAVVALARNLPKGESMNDDVLCYLNRLSDLLFVVARILARDLGGEVLWQPQKNKSPAKDN